MKNFRLMAAASCALVMGLLIALPMASAQTVASTGATGYRNGVALKPGKLYYYTNYPTDKTLIAQQVIVGGMATITGSGTVTISGYLSNPTWCVASLAQDSAISGDTVTSTCTATTLTIKVWKPTASGDATSTNATVAKSVCWTVGGAS